MLKCYDFVLIQICIWSFQTTGCSICSLVAKGDDRYPPVLHRRHPIKVDLPGEWFSENCETRPNSHFLTRRLLFSNNNQSWEGYYYHYADGLCREPMFTIYAKGTYVAGMPSPHVAYSFHYDFKVLQVKITPEDERISRTLNEQQDRSKCGLKGEWEVAVEQDVTPTRGCTPLGISVPHVEYELLKVEKEHRKYKLYLGQRASDNKDPTTPHRRPTSFQLPLIKCSRHMNKDFKPPVKAKVHVYPSSAACLLSPTSYLGLLLAISFYLHLL